MKSKFMGWKANGYVKTFYFFWLPLKRKVKTESSVFSEFEKIKTSYLPAMATHPEVFGKYKGCYAGKDVVIIACGPTLDKYTPIPGAIHIGVNRAFLSKHVELDYLVMIDGHPHLDESQLINYRPGKCRKLFGMHPTDQRISETLCKACDAERFYLELVSPFNQGKRLPFDLAHMPMRVSASVVSSAVQFALWCHPRRLYLVGCDCANNGYHAGDKGPIAQNLCVGDMYPEWQRLGEFAKEMYPDTELISINPVGLRGLFKDMKMENGELSELPPLS